MAPKDTDDFVSTDTTAEVPKARTSKATEELAIPAEHAQLVIVSGLGRGRRFTVDNEVSIGRHPGSTIWLPSDSISRTHARVFWRSDSYWIEDCGSRNGTHVNGLPVTRHQLTMGDKISIGSESILVFTYASPVEEQMLQLQKMEAVGRLAAGVAHEFNNILAIVVNNTSLLIEHRETLSSEEREVCLVETRNAATRGGVMARQMLDFSRAGSLEMAPVSMATLAEEIVSLLNRSLGPQIKLVAKIAPGVFVRGDRVQLYQVLMNLCINAADAQQKKGVIELSVRSRTINRSDLALMPHLSPGRFVELVVADTGIGMSAETMQHAFEPFFTTKEPGKGTGLGLSMVHGIVRRHDGGIRIDSEQRKGTTVTVWFPQINEPTNRTNQVVPTSQPQCKGRVLVVDDDELVLRSIVRVLKSLGLETVPVSDGREAIRIYGEQRGTIKLVLLDLLMPGLGGAETLSILRKLDPSLHIWISSGHADATMAKQLIASGAKGVLNKPYRPDQLQQAITAALRSP